MRRRAERPVPLGNHARSRGEARRHGLPTTRPLELVHRPIQQWRSSRRTRFARRFAGLAKQTSDAIDLMMADRNLATALHYFGDQGEARHHIERALAQLAALAQQPQIVRVRFEMRVSTHYFRLASCGCKDCRAGAARGRAQYRGRERRRPGLVVLQCPGPGACPIAYGRAILTPPSATARCWSSIPSATRSVCGKSGPAVSTAW